MKDRPPCSVPGCDTPSLARCLCNKHYKRFMAHGDPSFTLMSRGNDPEILSDDGEIQKWCCKCGEVKPVSLFYKQKNGMHGVRRDCKECNKQKAAAHRKSNPEYYERYHAENADHTKERLARYLADNRDEINRKKREWRKKNPEKSSSRYKIDPVSAREYDREYRKRNIERLRVKARDTMRERRKLPKHRLNATIVSGVKRGLKIGSKGGRRTFALLGYTAVQLMAHLESQFLPGMTWDNFGFNGWNIDHKIPLSAHNFETPDDLDFKRAWALENLQPMWQFDNYSKGSRLEKPFQPQLLLSEPAE